MLPNAYRRASCCTQFVTLNALFLGTLVLDQKVREAQPHAPLLAFTRWLLDSFFGPIMAYQVPEDLYRDQVDRSLYVMSVVNSQYALADTVIADAATQGALANPSSDDMDWRKTMKREKMKMKRKTNDEEDNSNMDTIDRMRIVTQSIASADAPWYSAMLPWTMSLCTTTRLRRWRSCATTSLMLSSSTSPCIVHSKCRCASRLPPTWTTRTSLLRLPQATHGF